MRSDTAKTRDMLIAAAESLFAEKGIDAVSLADINRKARQKNQRAVTYHFGDKAGLVNAILDKHADRIEQRRAEMLEALPDAPSLRQLIEVLLFPLVEKLDDDDGGVDFLKISNHLAISNAYADLRQARDRKRGQLQRIMELMAVHLPPQFETEWRARDLIVNSLLFQSLPAFASSPARIDRETYLELVISTIEALLTRPVSATL